MSEYIKKEDAVASAKALLFCYGSDNITDEQLDEYAEEFMNDDNTIIEVVRCKDCKWWTKQEDSLQGRCALMQGRRRVPCYPTEAWFCANGERKDNE